MFGKIWKLLREWVTKNEQDEHLYQQLIQNEYTSIRYAVNHAQNLQQLLAARTRIREFQKLLIENRYEYWGRTFLVDLNKIWNARYKHWKNKMRNQ